MSSKKIDKLDAAVLAASGVDGTDHEALAEAYSKWVPVYLVKMALHGIPAVSCLCGHRLSGYAHILVNKETGELLGPVGRKCIERFGSKDAVKRLVALSLLEEQNYYSRHYGKELPVRPSECIVEHAVSRATIDGLLAIDALEPVPGDGFPKYDANGAYRLLLDVFYKYKTGIDLRPEAHELVEARVREHFEAWCKEGARILVSLTRAAA